MPRKKSQKPEEEGFIPNLDRIFGFKDGVLYVGGAPADPFMVESLKSEASMIKTTELLHILGSTVSNEAARFALEGAKVGETAEMRSNKLAFAQALSAWNLQVWTTIMKLSKM